MVILIPVSLLLFHFAYAQNRLMIGVVLFLSSKTIKDRNVFITGLIQMNALAETLTVIYIL